jgi:hypothetical protein
MEELWHDLRRAGRHERGVAHYSRASVAQLDRAFVFGSKCWHAVGIGDPITSQTLPQIFGFADINNFIVCVLHQINARATPRIAEELPSQPPVERSRIRDKEQLTQVGDYLRNIEIKSILVGSYHQQCPLNCAKQRGKWVAGALHY